jgi:hypothetical protein
VHGVSNVTRSVNASSATASASQAAARQRAAAGVPRCRRTCAAERLPCSSTVTAAWHGAQPPTLTDRPK